MPRYIVTRKRHLFERFEVDAPSAAEAKRRADDAAALGVTLTWRGFPENWATQKVSGS